MGKLSNGVQKRKRDGKSILVIDFRFETRTGASSASRSLEAPHHATLRARHRRGPSRREWEMQTTQPGKYRTGLPFLSTRSGRADSTVAIHKGACSCAISMISATFEFATPPHGDAK